MLIGIDPVLVSLGPLAVRWFGLLALAGLGAAIWLSLRALRQQGLGQARALDALAWGLPVGLLTAWLVHALAYWDYYLTNPEQLWRLNLDALSLWGGLVGGGLVAAARLGRGRAHQRRRVLDAVAPYVLLGIAIGRLGEFVDGQGQGLPSTLPWATQYTNPLAATPDFGVARHPAQLYDALVALALFGLLWLVPRSWWPGARWALAMIGYAAARLVLGSVRLDPAFAFGLQIEQLLALGCIVLGVIFDLRPLVRRGAAEIAPTVANSAAEATHHEGEEDSLAA
jgi:phosphatidylglycerol:prolipoprotein diacylglycerol transferase